jgi:VIT1/CCC1 family predicted Fe2+/Mn2+ transporter
MTNTHSSRVASGAYVRNFIFGVEDSIVSTVGLISGIALAGVSLHNIIVTGVVLIFVEAFSMAAGAFLAEESAEEYVEQKEVKEGPALRSSLVMFFSYLVSGLVPLTPYVLLSRDLAFPVSIGVSILVLAALGFFSARVSKTHPWRHIVRMCVVGGAAIAVGILAGQLASGIGF